MWAGFSRTTLSTYRVCSENCSYVACNIQIVGQAESEPPATTHVHAQCEGCIDCILDASSGDNLLELYKQWKSQAGYAWKRPSPDSLAAVAGLLIERQQGKDAIVVASEVAVGDAHAGAHVVQACINGAQQDEDLCDVLAQAMPIFHKAQCHDDVI